MAGTALGHRALPASPLMMRRRKEEPMGRPPGAGIDREVASGHEDQFPTPSGATVVGSVRTPSAGLPARGEVRRFQSSAATASIGAFDLNSPVNAALVLPDCRHWFSNVACSTQ
jgi:hypothetical protein